MFSYNFSRWSAVPDHYIFLSQDEEATRKVRKGSIHKAIKSLADALRSGIRDGHSCQFRQQYGGPPSKVFMDILDFIFAQNINASSFSTYGGQFDPGINKVIYKAIQQFVHIKIINAFDGSCTYQDIENFMSKDIQKLLQ